MWAWVGRREEMEWRTMPMANSGQCAVIRMLAEDRPTVMTAPDKQQSTNWKNQTFVVTTSYQLS